MKISTFFLFFSLFQLSASTFYAQDALVTINMERATLDKIFKSIENQSNLEFFFNDKQLNVNEVMSIQMENVKISEVLNKVLANQGLDYKLIGRHIILVKHNSFESTWLNELNTIIQGKKVTGIITDATSGEPIIGANILIEGTTIGVSSDVKGMYSITIPKPGSVLVVSFLGYISERITLLDQTSLDIKLVPDITKLEEVVVVGYGTQSKKDISGSIAVVSEKNFNIGATQSAVDLIQGKVAGLSINTSSSDVTSQPSVFMRGISSLSGAVSPFYVIDGVPGLDLNSVAPQDIESISVLKDASASAIYGSRAASGVILITTKKGKEGQTIVEYSNKTMTGYVAEKPSVLSATEYRDYAKKIGVDISANDKGVNTDWFKEITHQGKISQEHHISASGGSEKNNYRASLNYLNNQGIVNGNFMERYNALFTFNQKAINDKLDISFTGGASKDNNRGILYYSSVYNLLPIWPVKNADGTWWETYDISGGNPVHSLAENKSLNKNYSLYVNMKANLEILKGLYAGLNLYTERRGNDMGSSYGRTTFEGNSDHGDASKSNSISDKSILELTMKYLKKINKNSIEILGGYSYEHYDNQYTGVSVRGFISDVFGYDNLSAADITKVRQGDITSGGDMSKLIGFFGRLNYNFGDKYIFAATLRRDGSSKFGDNNKWGTFPSLSVAWRINSEPFMSSFTTLNDLKLRLGYGITGNQDGIGPYNSLALYSSGPLYYNNGQWQNTYQYSQNPNPNLKWEQTSTLNAGLDYSFFNNRLNGSVEYYIRKTSNLLYTYPVPVPPYLYPTILANVGDISNKGIEFMINADIIRKQDFRWTISFNVAHNKQLITKLSNDQFKIQNSMVGLVQGRGQTGTNTHILREGEEISTFYGPKCLGLDNNGMYIIQDVDKNGTIDSRDNQVIGHAMPKATYGITNTISYKGFDFSFFLRGVYGNDIFNNDRLQMGNPTNFPAQIYKSATTTALRDKMAYNSYYIEKGSFLRLQNANIGYNFNTKNYLGIKKCKVYLAGENLFIITKYTGMDPELAANNGTGGILAQGIDPGALAPLIRRFILGVNVVF